MREHARDAKRPIPQMKRPFLWKNAFINNECLAAITPISTKCSNANGSTATLKTLQTDK